MLDLTIDQHEYGALDGLSLSEVASHRPHPPGAVLYTHLADGTGVEVDAAFISERLESLLQQLDLEGFDLIVLVSTGVYEPFIIHTPLVHGGLAVDAWIAALIVGDCHIGVIYPLPGQAHTSHGTLIQSAHAVAATGDANRLEGAAEPLQDADLILMHSVGYTDANARQISSATGKLVVTARRIIGGATRLHLTELAGTVDPAAPTPLNGAALLERLPAPAVLLTQRESEVLCLVLEGEMNKAIGRRLGISHRTVEIHRSRAMSKLGASSPTELIRRALIHNRPANLAQGV